MGALMGGVVGEAGCLQGTGSWRLQHQTDKHQEANEIQGIKSPDPEPLQGPPVLAEPRTWSNLGPAQSAPPPRPH